MIDLLDHAADKIYLLREKMDKNYIQPGFFLSTSLCLCRATSFCFHLIVSNFFGPSLST